MRIIFFILIVLSVSGCGNTIYIVRHAEKAAPARTEMQMMSTDVPLSAAGEKRAEALKEKLKNKRLRYIFSTNTLRTRSTAAPLLAIHPSMPLNLYSSRPDSSGKLISRLQEIRKGNILVVGHSNTIAGIANQLCGKKVADDLADHQYNFLFVLKRKGDRFVFKRKTYGEGNGEWAIGIGQ